MISYKIVQGYPEPPINTGRPRGSGRNLNLLRKMVAGDAIVNVPKKKMDSFRTSARMAKIKLRVRKLANGRYWIAKLTQ